MHEIDGQFRKGWPFSVLGGFAASHGLKRAVSGLLPHLLKDLFAEAAREHTERPFATTGLADAVGYPVFLPSQAVDLICFDP